MKKEAIEQARVYDELFDGNLNQWFLTHGKMFMKIETIYRLHKNRIHFHKDILRKVINKIN